MHQLHPEVHADIDVEGFVLDEARDALADRPWVFVNMVTSVDGATAADGRSGALGGPADKLVFHALRAAADVVVAGAATVRAEHYGPPRVAPRLQQLRRARGQAPVPRLAVVSGRLDLDLDDPFFRDAAVRPIVITHRNAPGSRVTAAAEVADVIVAGDSAVDLVGMLAQLSELGVGRVLVEGGPTLNGQLVAAGLVDELCLTVSPWLVGGNSNRVAVGDGDGGLTRLRLDRVLGDGDQLFLRYLRA